MSGIDTNQSLQGRQQVAPGADSAGHHVPGVLGRNEGLYEGDAQRAAAFNGSSRTFKSWAILNPPFTC